MDFLKIYKEWKDNDYFDDDTRCELEKLDTQKDIKEIEDRFYKNLDFGTAGLRGIMGAGTNRLNKYTIAKATCGFGKYLLDKFGEESCRKQGVVVDFDTRNNSQFFAETTANVLSAMGIKVYLYKSPRPIPVLSFSIRTLNCLGGIMITASHNTREYNGYKVYNGNGGQLVEKESSEVIAFVNSVKKLTEINFEANKKLIKKIDFTKKYVKQILKLDYFGDKEAKKNLSFVYTSLHGTGLIPVVLTLKKDGFDVVVTKKQADFDGDFPTVKSPNPENQSALELALKEAEKIDADIVFGTDPDCDRVGVAVKTKNGYVQLTGNQVGYLLVDFVCASEKRFELKKPAIITSLVTSDLGFAIARKNNVSTFSILTGFKYVGEKMTQFDEAKKANDELRNFDFLMGYEESCGYLVGTHSQDKDGVIACKLVCEMAAKLKAEGKTLVDRLNELYKEYGYYLDTQDNFVYTGKEGTEKIQNIMDTLRKTKNVFKNQKSVIDFKKTVKCEEGFGTYEKSNVLKYLLDDGSWIVARPSGTEPKIKFYYCIKGENQKDAKAKLEAYKKEIKKVAKL